MPYLFVSYRRSDASGQAGRVYDWLAARFGRDAVFKDIDSIHAGDDFAAVIETTIERSDAVLAVIGPRWLQRERLAEPDDWVRRELREALERGVRIVPILVDGGVMPPVQSLPRDLKRLARLQAVQLGEETWSTQLEGVMKDLGLHRRWAIRRVAVFAAPAAVAVVAATAIVAVAWRGDNGAARAGALGERADVEQICTSLNRADSERAAATVELRLQLRHARTTDAQRDALLNTQRRLLAFSDYDLARLRSVDVPSRLAASHRIAVAAWSRNNQRIQTYVEGLATAATRADLLAAIDALMRSRQAIERDAVTVAAEMLRLGDGQCRLAPPKVTGVVWLPALRRASHGQPLVNPPTSSSPAAGGAEGGG